MKVSDAKLVPNDADRIALQRYMVERARLSFGGTTAPHADLLLETLARHRHEAIEMAAKVADQRCEAVKGLGINAALAVFFALPDAIRALAGDMK